LSTIIPTIVDTINHTIIAPFFTLSPDHHNNCAPNWSVFALFPPSHASHLIRYC
jgi:hypothetical protein